MNFVTGNPGGSLMEKITVLSPDGNFETYRPDEKSNKQPSLDNRVTKANQLVEAHYKLTAKEQKFILAVVSMIEPNDTAFKEYYIQISDLLKILGVNQPDYGPRLERWIRNLFKKPVTIRKEGSGFLIANWLSSFETFPGEGYVAICFDPKLKPYLLKLKSRFTTYRIENIVQLGSAYSIRLYEILKGLENAQLKQRTFQINDLRSMLGIEDSKYAHFGHFRSRVLETAKAEITEKTDISFTYSERKFGRRVEWLIFTVTKRKQAFVTEPGSSDEIDLADVTHPDIDPSILEYIPPFFRSHHETLRTVAEAIEKYGNGYVMRNLGYVATRHPGHYPAYLAHAFRKDYGRNFSPQQQVLFEPTPRASQPEPEPVQPAASAQEPERPISGGKKRLMEQPLDNARPKPRPQVQIIPGERVMYGGQEYVIESAKSIYLGKGTSLTEMQIRSKVAVGEITPCADCDTI